MNKFSNKLKKTLFLAHFRSIFPIFGAKKFSWKIRLCHAQLHMGFSHHAKIYKKLMMQFKENAWTDGRMEGREDRRMDRPYL